MSAKTITCYFCFEEFEVFLEADRSFSGNNDEIYDCEVCCNPNKIRYAVDQGEIYITEVSDGNE